MQPNLGGLALEFNPFEPSASGEPIVQSTTEMWLPKSWLSKLQTTLDQLSNAKGSKALAIAGEYGSGKTYILQWLNRIELPGRRIRPFILSNPGVYFYKLADALLKEIGRKEFAKSVWELAGPHVTGGLQISMFSKGFEEYLQAQRMRKNTDPTLAKDQFANAIRACGITGREDIAFRLADLVLETAKKPYFEYRDFIAGKPGALVPEGEEVGYFGAVLKTLRLAANTTSVAFLIDEFEEISLSKILSRREAHDYLATLKRLLSLTKDEDLWVFVAMTEEAVEQTSEIEPALWQRFIGDGDYLFRIPPLNADDAQQIVSHRLSNARIHTQKKVESLFPFPKDFPSMLMPATYSNPRRLVKYCYHAISSSGDEETPFKTEFLHRIESTIYPSIQRL